MATETLDTTIRRDDIRFAIYGIEYAEPVQGIATTHFLVSGRCGGLRYEQAGQAVRVGRVELDENGIYHSDEYAAVCRQIHAKLQEKMDETALWLQARNPSMGDAIRSDDVPEYLANPAPAARTPEEDELFKLDDDGEDD